MTTPEASHGRRPGPENGARGLGRRAAALTLAAAGVLGITAGAVASRLPAPGRDDVAAAPVEGPPTSGSMPPAVPPPGPVTPSSVPTTTAAPPTTRTARSPASTATTRAALPSTPPPLGDTLLRLSDWRRAGLSSPASVPARRAASRCQDAELGSMAGVRGARYATVTAGPFTGVEVVAQTHTPEEADAVLRSVVGWRDTCNPTKPYRAYLGTSDLLTIRADARAALYAWTFVFDPVTDDGNSLIEQVVLARDGNRVALVVVSREVPAGTSRTSKSPVDQTVLGRLAASRLT